MDDMPERGNRETSYRPPEQVTNSDGSVSTVASVPEWRNERRVHTRRRQVAKTVGGKPPTQSEHPIPGTESPDINSKEFRARVDQHADHDDSKISTHTSRTHPDD